MKGMYGVDTMAKGNEKENRTEKLIRELPKGLLKWYPFHENSRTLFVADRTEQGEVLLEALAEYDMEVDCKSPNEIVLGDSLEAEIRYEYIVLVGVLERRKDPEALLAALRDRLTPRGRLLLGIDNRLGIRYFCGDRDVFTERNFDSIENYARINMSDMEMMGGRAYARAEIVQMLEAAGFRWHRFYSVLPQLERPQALYAEDYIPEEELDVRICPQYYSPDTVFLEEGRLYTTLLQNGLFHAMANGYFVECPIDGSFCHVNQVTISMDRGAENALVTIISRDDTVIKKALYAEGQEKLTQLLENTTDLKNHGVHMVNAELKDDIYVMPYVHGEPATDYFRRLLRSDVELFLKELDRFWEIIQNSSEHVPYEAVDWEYFDPDWRKWKADDPGRNKWREVAFDGERGQKDLGIILKRGYIDLVSLNCIYADGEFIFYDQEFYVENLPAYVIFMRTIGFIYWENTEMEALFPEAQLRERYHLNQYAELWGRFSNHFIWKLRNEVELSSYHQSCRRDKETVNSNRQRINYSVDEYERLFRDIFRGTEGRQVYLFGSGNFTRKFLSEFGSDYEIAGILDNNCDKWGTELSGIRISGPDCLKALPSESYKVIICIKNYVPVIKQLKALGTSNYGVYDWNLAYPRKALNVTGETGKGEKQTPKKYHTGYIAGVFDLFHIGHLNLLRRAKEHCDYLIVGVVSDESVIRSKKTMPCIPFEERIEIVRSCRYVDEAVGIPTDFGSTEEAYRRYHFDVQFSGSDYTDDPIWQSKKAYLQKQGADMVFFPYTKSTSSTKLKGMIEKKLM